jgi:predicted nucleic acid-binding protein
MVIDTNVYSALERGSDLATSAIAGQSSLQVPLMVVAELRFGFINGAKHKLNEERLIRFLAQPNVEVLLPTLKTSELYAKLSTHCRQSGRALSQNDIWIAALAKEHNKKFVTYDNDFKVFQELFGKDLLVLE